MAIKDWTDKITPPDAAAMEEARRRQAQKVLRRRGALAQGSRHDGLHQQLVPARPRRFKQFAQRGATERQRVLVGAGGAQHERGDKIRTFQRQTQRHTGAHRPAQHGAGRAAPFDLRRGRGDGAGE